MAHARRSAGSTAGAIVLAIAVVILPLWRGGVDWPALLFAALATPLALLLTARSEALVPRLGVLLVGVVVYMGLQLVPLPPPLHALSPSTRGLFELALEPIGLYPRARPLSLDPPATAREAAKAIVGLCAFGAAWAAGVGRRRRAIVIGAIAVSGLAVAAATLGSAALSVQPLLAPRFPFVNPNHLAGFSVLTAYPLLGLALRARGQERLLWLLGFVATSALAFLSLSRGGMAAFLAGAGLFATLAFRRTPRAGESGQGSRPVIGVAVAGTLAVAAFLALGPLVDELATSRGVQAEPKTALWLPALAMAREHALVGVGRGAFETAFAAYKTDPEQVTYTHLENEWLQAPVELGWPAGLLLVGALGLAWVAAARRRDLSWTEVGLLAGTGALAAQNAFDFSLELTGVSVPFMAALGMALRGAGPVPVRRWMVTAAALLLGLGAVAGLLRWRAAPPESQSQAIATAPDLQATIAAAKAAAEVRPADYVPQATAGIRLVEAGRCADALPWLSRAMLLNPTAPESHLHAARCLAAGGQRVLALREFRLAWSYGAPSAFSEAAAWYPSVEDLMEVAPATPDGLVRLGLALESSRPADAAVAFRRALEEFGEEAALLPLARASRAAGDREGARAGATARLARAPTDAAAWRILALVSLDEGDETGAMEVARRGLAAAPGAASLLGFLFDRAMAKQRFAEARRLASEIVTHTPAELSARLLLEARALGAQGRMGEAIEAASSAAAAQPSAVGPLLALATFSEQAGRFDDAIAALERAAALPGQNPENFRDRLAALAAGKAAQSERRRLQGLER